MPSVNERLALIVTASTGGAVRGLNQVTAATKEMGAAVGVAKKRLDESAASGATGAGALASRFGGASAAFLGASIASGVLVSALGDMTEASSALAEQQSATNVVFGAGAATVKQFAAGAADSIGVSNRAALQAANGFGNLFTNLGIGEKESAKLSVGLVQLAGDLASFRDLPTEDVLAKLQSGLNGEAEPLRAVGVFLNELNVQAKAASVGLGDAHGELTDGEKVLARYLLIIDQTTKAQGDAARTAGSLANQQRKANAAAENAKADFGRALQGPQTFLTNRATDVLVGAQGTFNAVGGLFNKVKGAFTDSGNAARGAAAGTKEASETSRLLAEADTAAAAAAKQLAKANVDVWLSTQGRAAAQSSAASTIDAAIDAERGLISAKRSIADADRAAAGAARGVADARRGVRDAQERLNDVLADGEQVTRRIAQAQRNLARADEDVTDATGRLVKARKALADVAAGPSANDRGDAERRVQRAGLGVAEADQRVKDAQKRLADARAGKSSGGRFGGTDPDEVARAELELEEALLAVAEANDGLTDSQEDLNKVLNRGTEGSEELADAQRELRDAERQVTDALSRHEDAQRSLSDANAGVADHERAIRDAREGVAAATQRVADATAAAANAASAARDARDRYTDAVLRAAKAHEAENKLIDTGIIGLLLYRNELEALARQSPALYAALKPLLDRVNALIAANYDKNGGGDPRVRVGDATPTAEGDIVTGPQIRLIGEAGPEAVIPLSPSKRDRREYLMKKAGLGWANGGIAGRYVPPGVLNELQAVKARPLASFAFSFGDIHASGKTEGRQAAQAIVDLLSSWSRRNGPLPFRVTG